MTYYDFPMSYAFVARTI